LWRCKADIVPTLAKQETAMKQRKKSAAKRNPKPIKNMPRAAPRPPRSSKTDAILDLLKQPDGASIADIIKATDWQPHSVRAFLSATIAKRLGHAVISEKPTSGDRRYRIAEPEPRS
jgi:hypothetical protein